MKNILPLICALAVFIFFLTDDGAKTNGYYIGLVLIPTLVYFLVYMIIKKSGEINSEQSNAISSSNIGIHSNQRNNQDNTQKPNNISRIINSNGFYAANYNKVVRGESRDFFIFLFFVHEYVYLQNEHVEREVHVDQEFIDTVRLSIHDISSELSSDSLDFQQYKRNLSEFEIVDNTIVAEFYESKNDTIRLILFNNLMSGEARMNIEIEGFHYDLVDTQRSGFKTVRIVENAKIKYYKF